MQLSFSIFEYKVHNIETT